MKTDTKTVLEKILLPLNSRWEVLSVETDERNEEIFVNLHYKFDFFENDGIRYPIYDRRKERNRRHSDLWRYKTYTHRGHKCDIWKRKKQ
jgi:hypothetical protein